VHRETLVVSVTRETDMSTSVAIRQITTLLGALLLCLAASSFGSRGAVQATPSFGFTSDTATATGVPEINIKSLSSTHQVRLRTKGPSDVHVTVNTVVPGGQSGWHTHPGPSFVVVKSGTATLYDGDDPTCTPRTIETNGWFTDPGGGHVHLVRNEDSVDLVLAAFQVVPADAPRRIDADNPGFCGF
jgi:mannose-6-phosphate isomerase-like protein (cupin superfamily)